VAGDHDVLDARLSSGRYVDDGASAAAPSADAADHGRWDMERAPRSEPLSGAEKNAAKRGDAASSFWTWSTPASRTLRITSTPQITLNAGTSGNVMVRLWDVAPDGTATM
jgi:hypothetical protein